jgi:hypothetical protein
MITHDSIEAAYCFFHQKWRVYERSHSDVQRDDIEYAIANYTSQMSPELYRLLADGQKDYLNDHSTFSRQMPEAIDRLEKML